jgi:hypothetical protein
VYAEGKTVQCYTGCQIKEDGTYEINGLLPGSYEMKIYGWGNFEYAKPKMGLVTVAADSITLLDIQLQPGQRCYPSITGDLTYASGKMKPDWERRVIGLPSGVKFDKNKMVNAIFDDPEISFHEDTRDIFGMQYLPYGTYDFYVSPDQDWDKLENSDEFMMYVLFAGEKKGVEINNLVEKGTIPAGHWAAGQQAVIIDVATTVGEAVLEGTLSGDNIFKLTADQLASMAQNFDEFINYIPSVILYDTDGVMRAWAMEVPPTKAGGNAWETAVMTGDLARIQEALRLYPPRYRIEALPEGSYTFVAFSPTYRTPVIRQITIPASGTTRVDVNFDLEIGEGASFIGVVKDKTSGSPVANATVILKSRITDEELVATDAQGGYIFRGLQQGTYEISVTKSGYALTGARKALMKNSSVQVNINLEIAPGSFSGTVYLRMMPSPQVFPGAELYAYDETFNGSYPKEYLPRYSAVTDKNGQYTISGVVSGHLYKLYMVSDGKQLEYLEKTATTTDLPGCDFVMRSAPPESNIRSRISEDGKTIEFFAQSPKKLVATPACQYQEGTAYDDAKAYTAVNALAKPNNLYKISITPPSTQTNYVLRIVADDGANEPAVFETVFNLSMKAKSKKDLKGEIAAGGDVYMTEGTDDLTSLGIQTGGLTPSGASISSSPGLGAAGINPQAAVGGFISTLPGVQISKENRNVSTLLMNLISSVLVSDLFTIDLSSAQVNRDLTVSLNYDKTRVDNMDALKIYQYDSSTGQWNVLPGTPMIDPITGTISVDVESLGNASGAQSAQSAPRMAGKALFNGAKYVINANAATEQSGTFAVFSAPPPSNKEYTGGEFKAYNFPNPFNLKTKLLDLNDATSISATMETKGTIIKYYMPASVSGNTKIFIYNIAGEMVRQIDEGNKTGGYIFYTEWDGRNDNGSDVASGVYSGMIKVDNKKKVTFKMAVIK